MKQLLYIAMASLCIAFSAISCKTNTPIDASEKTTLPHDKFVHGKVTKVQHGTDGYMAFVRATDGHIYHITASIPNCGEHGNFKTVQVGDSVEVQGDYWLMGRQRCITVRTFLK